MVCICLHPLRDEFFCEGAICRSIMISMDDLGPQNARALESWILFTEQRNRPLSCFQPPRRGGCKHFVGLGSSPVSRSSSFDCHGSIGYQKPGALTSFSQMVSQFAQKIGAELCRCRCHRHVILVLSILICG